MRQSLAWAGVLAATLMSATAAVGETTSGGPPPLPAGDYPPGAQPGECFAKVLVPEVAETTSDRVLATPERTISRVIAGQCAWQDKTEVVRQPSVELINRPATYRTVTESVVVRPAGFRTETIPPVYETVTEQVMVRSGYRTWRQGTSASAYAPAPYDAGDNAAETQVLPTGEVLCLIEVPPEYRMVSRQILKTPQQIIQVPYPAEMGLVSRQVVDVPAHTEKRDVPGETRVVKAKICAPDQTVSETTPAEYKIVTTRRVISPARFEWRKADCKADVVHVAPPIVAPPPPVHRSRPPVRHHPCGCGPQAHPLAPRPAPAPPCAAAKACVPPKT